MIHCRPRCGRAGSREAVEDGYRILGLPSGVAGLAHPLSDDRFAPLRDFLRSPSSSAPFA